MRCFGFVCVVGVACLLNGGCGAASDASATADPPEDRVFMRVLPGDDVLELDPETGATQRLALTVGCGDTPHCLISTGDHLIFSGVGETMLLDDEARGSDDFRRLGDGWITVPAQEPDRVWLGILAPGQNRSRGLSVVREVDLDGNVVRSMEPPDGRWPLEATDEGLIFQYLNGLRLWSFEEQRLTERIPGPFPADTRGGLVASCEDPCERMAITDLETGAAERVAPPPGYEWSGGYYGAFSPDGAHFAAPVNEGGRRQDVSLAVVDVDDGSATLVPGSAHMESWYQSVAWSTSGDEVLWSTEGQALMAFGPETGETERIAELHLGPQGRVMQLVTVRAGKR